MHVSAQLRSCSACACMQLATTAEVMRKVFIPEAAANGAGVKATVLFTSSDSATAIGDGHLRLHREDQALCACHHAPEQRLA